MYATPNGAVATVISVPGEAARVASSPMSRETLSEMFGFTTRILIATPHQVAVGCASRSGKPTRAVRERASVRLFECRRGAGGRPPSGRQGPRGDGAKEISA